MKKSIVPFLVGILIISMLVAPASVAGAQVITFPAEMNNAFTPLSIPAGGTARLRVSIYNPNAFSLTNASWTDDLIRDQPGLVIADPAGVINTCGGTVTAVPGTTTLALSGGTVPAQSGSTPGSCTVSINVTATVVGNLINTIPAGALSSSGGGTTISNTDPASATLYVGGVLPPSIQKSFSSSTIWVGEISRLSIVIRNDSPNTSLTQASLTDDLPPNVFVADPVSPALSGCGTSAALTAVSGGSSVTLTNATIAPGSSCTVSVNVTSNLQGRYTNAIPAGALQTQEGLSNVTQALTRLNVEAIGLAKRFEPSTIAAGGTAKLEMIFRNPTASAYTGVSVTDDFPPPLILVGITANTCGGTVSTTSTSITLTGGTIPPGTPADPGECRITADITVPPGTPAGSIRNTIPGDTLTTDQGVGNLRPEDATLVISATEVVGRKAFSPSTIQINGNARLRIEIFAPSDTSLTNFSITDNLPAGLTVSNSSPPSTSGCGATPPLVLNAPTGATTISLTNGLIPAGQRCEIDVYVTGTTPGLYTNTIMPTDITNTENRMPAGEISTSLTVSGGGTLMIALVKGFEPLTVFGGSASTMSVQLINQSTVALSGITFTDTMPDGMILANPVSFNVGTCGGALSGTPGENAFTFSGGSLPALGICTLTLKATMTVNGNLTNTIPNSAVTTNEGVTNVDPAEATLTNLPGASIGKYFVSNPITAGSDTALTITIQNTGNIPLSGMGFSDSLPAGLAISDAAAPEPVNNCGGTLTAVQGTQLIQLTEGVLDGSSSCTLVVYITGDSPGSYQNTIPAGSLTTDSGTNVTNAVPATDTLVITDDQAGGGGDDDDDDERERRRERNESTTQTTGFLIPVTGFAPGRLTELNVLSQPVYDATSLTLEIPVLNVKTSIVGVEYKKRNWDVSWLQDQVGWLNRTAYPTWKGNSVLTAHVVNEDGKPGVFSGLKALGVGEYVFVYNAGYRYTYEVLSNELVQPGDERVVQHEERSFLTLITCDSYEEKTGTYLNRVAVRAALVDISALR